MNTDTKVAELPAKWRAWAKRIRGITAGSDLAADIMEGSAEDLEAALARQEAAPISVDRLAQIIRRLDSRQLTGAHEMAEAILAEVSIPAPALRSGGQEAVAWRYWSPSGNCWWTRYVAPTEDTSPESTNWEPLYAAPPAAQAVDLDGLRELADAVVITNATGNERLFLGAVEKLLARVRTLIDQQAGKRVDL